MLSMSSQHLYSLATTNRLLFKLLNLGTKERWVRTEVPARTAGPPLSMQEACPSYHWYLQHLLCTNNICLLGRLPGPDLIPSIKPPQFRVQAHGQIPAQPVQAAQNLQVLCF